MKVGLRNGITLKIPPPPKTAAEVDAMEDTAFSDPQYIEWEQKSQGLFPQPFNPSVSTYRWKESDNLPALAQRLYGDEDMYPLIVDANEDRLILPDNLVAGKTIKIPQLPREDKLDSIRDEAVNDAHYLWWRNVSREEKTEILPMTPAPPDSDE